MHSAPRARADAALRDLLIVIRTNLPPHPQQAVIATVSLQETRMESALPQPLRFEPCANDQPARPFPALIDEGWSACNDARKPTKIFLRKLCRILVSGASSGPNPIENARIGQSDSRVPTSSRRRRLPPWRAPEVLQPVERALDALAQPVESLLKLNGWFLLQRFRMTGLVPPSFSF